MLLSCIIPLYWVASILVVRQFWVCLEYSAAIPYKSDIFIPSRIGGIYQHGRDDALWTEDWKQDSSSEG